MPKEPPNKKQKQRDLLSFFQQNPEKQTARDNESGETSQVSDNVQIHGTAKNMPKGPPNKKQKKRDHQSPVGQTARVSESGETSHNAQERMGAITSETGRVIKEEKPSKSDHALLNAEGKTHTFQFRIRNGAKNKVVCDASKTVFGALNENVKFQSEDKEGKEIIIRRSKEQNHEAAVKTDFPCCLIEEDETLQINFYKDENSASNQETRKNQETTTDTDPESLVTFYIRTRGMPKKKIMKSSIFLDKTIDYVCVFAHKGDTIEKALQHDGRFSDDIFDEDKVCKLVDDEEINHPTKLPVDPCDGKKFELNVENKKPQAHVRSDKNDGESAKHSQQPNNTKQKTIQEEKTKGTDPSTEGSTTQNTSGNSSGDSVNSFFTDIQNILGTLCEDVLNQLKQQKNPKLQEFLQKEYDKGVDECFTVVNKVRQVMELSNSVCVIEDENDDVNPRKGTGFLLFDGFILTNAHVVKDFVNPHTHKLSRTLTAVFNYEVVRSKTINIHAKSDLIAYRYEKDEKLMFHDYALLELEAAPDNCTELLTCYKHGLSPNSGGIYIVGHPDCGVKKMDLCFIIGIENQLQSINKHRSENVSCPYVSWQCWPNLYKNQITYNSCFFHGSSGSPVFDAHGNLIGMHSGGFHYKEGERDRSVIEFSYSMKPIVEGIITQVKTKRRSDIIQLLKDEKFKHIQENFDLGEIEDTCGANMPVEEEQQTEVEEMDVN